MPSATNIVLTDGQASDHTFTPVGTTPRAVLVANEGANGSLDPTLVMGLSIANANRTTDRVNVYLKIPYAKTVDGVSVVRDVARANIECVLPELMTDTERDDFHAMLNDLVSDAIFEGYMKRDPMY